MYAHSKAETKVHTILDNSVAMRKSFQLILPFYHRGHHGGSIYQSLLMSANGSSSYIHCIVLLFCLKAQILAQLFFFFLPVTRAHTGKAVVIRFRLCQH